VPRLPPQTCESPPTPDWRIREDPTPGVHYYVLGLLDHLLGFAERSEERLGALDGLGSFTARDE
jgi:hypothetical protein